MNLKETLHAATSMAILLSIGFGLGWYYSHPGPLVYAAMENSTANLTPYMTPSSGTTLPYPCTGDYEHTHVRCVFVGENRTWTCTVDDRNRFGEPSYHNETCE